MWTWTRCLSSEWICCLSGHLLVRFSLVGVAPCSRVKLVANHTGYRDRRNFIAIISDAYTETQEQLKKQDDMEMATLVSEVRDYLLFDIIFKIPIVGPIVQRVYLTAEATAKATAEAGLNLTTKVSGAAMVLA